MERTYRNKLAFGVILVLIGCWFLAEQLFPGFSSFSNLFLVWPLNIIYLGAALLVFGVLIGSPNLAIPAAIVSGIGGILYYQSLTGNNNVWSYSWTLIPGFAGIGMVIAGFLGNSNRHKMVVGARLIFTSAVLFYILASLLGYFSLFGAYWPVLIIAFGLILVIQAFVKR